MRSNPKKRGKSPEPAARKVPMGSPREKRTVIAPKSKRTIPPAVSLVFKRSPPPASMRQRRGRNFQRLGSYGEGLRHGRKEPIAIRRAVLRGCRMNTDGFSFLPGDFLSMVYPIAGMSIAFEGKGKSWFIRSDNAQEGFIDNVAGRG